MRLTPTQQRCMASTQQRLDELRPKLEWFESVAKADPRYADEAQELRDLYDHLDTLRAACVAASTPAGR